MRKVQIILILLVLLYPAYIFAGRNEVNEDLMKCDLEVVQCDGELTMKEWVLNEVNQAGFNPKEAEQIINCESNFNRFATHKNRNGSTDNGVWQLNNNYTSPEIAFNYKTATKKAIEMRKAWGSWKAWVCWDLIN